MLAPFSAFPSRLPPSPQLTLSNRISCAPGVKLSSRITFWDFSPLGGHWRRSSSHTCSSQHCPPLAWCTYCYMYKSQCMLMMPIHVAAWRSCCYMYKSQCMMMIPVHAKELGQKGLPVSLHDVRVILWQEHFNNMTSLVDFVFRKSPSWEGNSGLKSIRNLFKQVVHLLNLFCGHGLDDEHLVSTREQSNEV